jgi:glucokinase
MLSYAIGVDLGGTNLRAAAVDESGVMLAKISEETEVRRGRERVVDDLCRSVAALIRQMRADTGGEPRGIGVGVPGLIDSETGRLVESPNLPGWSDFDVKGEIERRLGATVILENDANCAAVGEHWLGAARGFKSMCMYTLGTGVGGGWILDGRLWRGWNGMAAELGHCNVYPDGHICGCGSHGCLEQYASATAVVRMAREALAEGWQSELSQHGERLDSHAIYECAMRGDEVAREVFERVGRALGLAIATMVNAMNLPIHVIGGGVSSAWDAFAPAMFDELRKRSYIYASTTEANGVGKGGRKRATTITRAKLGGDAGLYGAARLPMGQE